MSKKVASKKSRTVSKGQRKRNHRPALRLVAPESDQSSQPFTPVAVAPTHPTANIALGEADHPHRPEHFPKMASWPGMALVCWLFTALVGMVGISGWFGAPRAYSGLGEQWAPIAQSEATLFIFLGLALVFYVYGVTRSLARPVVTSAIVLSTTFSVLKLIEILGESWFGIENLFNLKLYYFKKFLIGAMSPVSAMLFIASGVALVLLVLVTDKRNLAVKWAMGISSVCGLFSAIVILSYAFGNPILYSGTWTPLSLPAALAFLFLQAGMMIAIGPSHFPVRVSLNRD